MDEFLRITMICIGLTVAGNVALLSIGNESIAIHGFVTGILIVAGIALANRKRSQG